MISTWVDRLIRGKPCVWEKLLPTNTLPGSGTTFLFLFLVKMYNSFVYSVMSWMWSGQHNGPTQIPNVYVIGEFFLSFLDRQLTISAFRNFCLI